MSLSLQEAFSSLEDPRIERHKRHQLLDIIVLTICGNRSRPHSHNFQLLF